MMFRIYTDGACSGNPGPGGWAYAIINESGDDISKSGHVAETTNNRMELIAVIRALEWVHENQPDAEMVVITDSIYVKSGITTWIKSWKNNGWRTSSKQPVKNQDLWLTLDRLVHDKCIAWEWVKGHSGDLWNTRVDMAARSQTMRK